MSRMIRGSVPAVAALAMGLVWWTAGALGQPAGMPSTKNGDWTHYTADARGSKYSPLDQVNAANFNKLEVAWRFKTDNLGTRPEFKLEGTPLVINGMLYATAGTRRSVVALKADVARLASPKLSTFTTPSSRIMTFSGFTSRWTRPAR